MEKETIFGFKSVSSNSLFLQGEHKRSRNGGRGVFQGQIGSQKCEKWQKTLK